LISEVTLGNPSVTYRITPEGLKVLRNIDELLETLGLKEVL